jgi:tripartite-type tricarboxylate transporter receptor subunit TctC
MLKTFALFAGAALLLGASPAGAQTDFPTRPVKIIVALPAGGGVDTMTRIVAEGMRQYLGQPVVIENKGGQSGNIGAEAVFLAEPDGYTLLASQPSPLTVNMVLYKKINYDPTALVPVGIITRIPNTLTVRAGFPAKTVQEFIAYVKANPGKLNYASQGVGGGAHLATLMFQNATGTQMVHIPFGGAAPALQALVGGQVDLFIDNISSSLPLHQSGKLKILAMGSLKRAPELPDMPTLAEAGLRDLDLTTWFGMFAPPKTPAAIVTKLNGAINEIIAMPDFRSRVAALHIQLVGGTPQAFADFLAADRARWQAIIAGANIPAQ